MEQVIEKAGDYAGLAALFGLAVLSFLYIMQARHVRDLEDRATFLPEDVDLPTTPSVSTESRAPAKVGAAAPAPSADDPQGQLEAARQVEVARAAAERRERFQQRRGSGPFGRSGDGGEFGRRRPNARTLAMVGVGAVILIVGLILVLGRGGDDGEGTPGNPAESVQGTGAPLEVAVLNGTSVPGLAAKIGAQVREAGSYKLGDVTNTDTPFDLTTVMFDNSDPEANADAQELAQKLGVTEVIPLTGDVRKSLESPTSVVVIVGEDRAGE